MNIRLYGENDTRPQGAYNNIKRITMSTNGTNVFFETISGKHIYTTLRFKLTIETDEKSNIIKKHIGNELVFKDLFYYNPDGEEKAKTPKRRKTADSKEDKGLDETQGKLIL